MLKWDQRENPFQPTTWKTRTYRQPGFQSPSCQPVTLKCSEMVPAELEYQKFLIMLLQIYFVDFCCLGIPKENYQ